MLKQTTLASSRQIPFFVALPILPVLQKITKQCLVAQTPITDINKISNVAPVNIVSKKP